jgi:flagellar biosynthesis protein
MSAYSKTEKAAALKYEHKKDGDAPVIVASGLGYVAQKIVSVAQENNIPVYQDDSLASILSQLEAGAQIPEPLYQAVVDIYVYFLNFSFSEDAK